MRYRKGAWVGIALVASMWMGATQAATQATGAASGGASAQQVRELMDAIGLKGMLSQMNGVMVQQVAQLMPCVPAATVQAAFSNSQAQDDIINRMVPVYQRHFSSADIQGLLAFYRSPLGQKVLREMPATMQEGMQIGRQWGEQRAETMVAKLKQQGVLDAQGSCPAPRQAPAVPPPGKH
ncbi:MAG TPA: DUF2059 domain-containing protein [Rhodanobacteraceae bacterium]|nr:DUF2059 domain-containing protein [Rhodanobacteraceae bacterium]